MKLSRKQFRDALQKNSLKIAFIGMSNVGKTKFSKLLAAQRGFHRYEVDAEIGKRLTFASITSVASWMGFPDSDMYPARESEYLNLEELCTREGVKRLSGNAVLDTTGSVIYLSDSVLKEFKKNWLIVYIRSNDRDIDDMFSVFMKEPKPVIWGGMFSVLPGENRNAALKRCYPELLRERMRMYEALADISVNRFSLYKAKRAQDILSVIEIALRD